MSEQTDGITPVAEDAADGQVKEVFEEIRATLQVSEVPLFYRIIAHIPLYLETTWRRVRFALLEDGALETRTKWMAALAVSASNNNRPMIVESTERLKELGTSDTQLAELMAVVDVVNGMNKTFKAAGIR
jgi:alkylhydroperoxidase/carboxymuconolactone decarboxylase family protein YurZ